MNRFSFGLRIGSRVHQGTNVDYLNLVWFTDLHVGDPTMNQQLIDDLATGITSKNTPKIVTTGDILHSGQESQYDTFIAAFPNTQTIGGSHDYPYFTSHFIVDNKNTRIIAFYANYVARTATLDNPSIYAANVSTEELAWIENNMIGAGNKNIILIGHYPLFQIYQPVGYISDGYGRSEMISLCNTYNVKLYLSGHLHGANEAIIVGNNTLCINGLSVVDSDAFYTVIADIEKIQISPLSSLSPYAEYSSIYSMYKAINTVYLTDVIHFSVISMGTGLGVSTLTLASSENVLLTLDGSAKFYTNITATEGESSTYTVTSGADRVIYIKCVSGTSNLIIDKNKITRFVGWVTPTNAPQMGGNICKLTANTFLSFTGANLFTGNLSLVPNLTTINANQDHTLSGEISGLIYLTDCTINGTKNSVKITNVTNIKGLRRLVIPQSIPFSAANINQIAADFWLNRNEAKIGATTRILNLMGHVLTEAPTGQGITDIEALRTYSYPQGVVVWTVTART